jgi:hypothetical protein
MSGEDFENLVRLFGPAVNNKNINFRNAISDGKLGSSTATSCSLRFQSQHDVPVERFNKVNIVNTTTV